MSPLLCSWGFESKLDLLTPIFNTRLRLAITALVIQIIAICVTLRPFFFTNLFNTPAVLALILCLQKGKLCDYKTQKNIKFLLKIGIAKAIGGVLLAIFMGLKYAYSPSTSGIYTGLGSTQGSYLKMCVVSFTTSAIIDIFYSLLAKDIISNTKQIVSHLKEKKPRSQRSSRAGSPRLTAVSKVLEEKQEP